MFHYSYKNKFKNPKKKIQKKPQKTATMLNTPTLRPPNSIHSDGTYLCICILGGVFEESVDR